MLPLEAAAWLALIGCAVAASVRAARVRRLGRTALHPLAICLCAVLLAVYFPFTDVWLAANYHWYRPARAEVVRQVQRGELRPNVAHNPSLIALPPGTPLVSMGGNEIIVEVHDGQPYVFFFTYRGILDNYSGFLFVPAGGDPRRFSDLGEPTTQLVEREEHWYFAAHR
jgi:hypothetical protein